MDTANAIESILPPNLCIFGFKGIAITLIFALNKTMLVFLVYCFDIGLCSQVGFPGGLIGKESACSAGDSGSIPGLGRSPGGGNSYPLQNSCLENSIDYIVHGVTKSQTRLSNFHFVLKLHVVRSNYCYSNFMSQFKMRILFLGCIWINLFLTARWQIPSFMKYLLHLLVSCTSSILFSSR